MPAVLPAHLVLSCSAGSSAEHDPLGHAAALQVIRAYYTQLDANSRGMVGGSCGGAGGHRSGLAPEQQVCSGPFAACVPAWCLVLAMLQLASLLSRSFLSANPNHTPTLVRRSRRRC